MIVGCYTLDLYCDSPKCDRRNPNQPSMPYQFPDQFTGETRGPCVREARRAGWKVGNEALCPTCFGPLKLKGRWKK